MIVLQLLLILVLCFAVLFLVAWGISAADEGIARWKATRRARFEAELDRKQEELRRTILAVADGLANDRDEASRQMARAAFLTTGSMPERTQP